MEKASHISILPGSVEFPSRFQKCDKSSCSCGGLFHCYLCSDSKKATKECILRAHFQRHWKDRIVHEGNTILRCNLECSEGYKNRSHWHCCYCRQLFLRKGKIISHLQRHLRPLKQPSIEKHFKVPIQQSSKEDFQTSCPPTGKLSSKSKTTDDNSDRCNECNKVYPNKSALKRHVREQHKKKVDGLIHAGRYLNRVCVDVKRGIFLVCRAFKGIRQPIHCQHSTSDAGEPVATACELDDCREASKVACNSGQPAFECVHLRSIQYSRPFVTPQRLLDSTLDDLSGGKVRWFKESTKGECLAHRKKAEEGNFPLVVRQVSEQLSSQRFVFLSVWDGNVHYYSRFGRVVVTYDKDLNRWMCACCRFKVSCIHKSVSKWFLYQTDPQILDLKAPGYESQTNDSDDADYEGEENEEATSNEYPPTGKTLQRMVRYIHLSKKVPSSISQHLLKLDVTNETNDFIPTESQCCGIPLTGPHEITRRAMVITTTKVLRGSTTFFKRCASCGMIYRYQDINQGVHNYDDRHLFSLGFMVFLRAFMKENTAVGRSVAALKSMNAELCSVPDSVFRNAYYHFEALSDHQYNFFCYKCGHHPPVLIWDLCKKGCFSLALDGLEVPEVSDENDTVDIKEFWDRVHENIIFRGLINGQKGNPFNIAPSYTFWSPWIGKFTRRCARVYNTEYRKVAGLAKDEGTSQPSMDNISEEDLIEMMQFSQVKTLQKTCRSLGASNVGGMSKMECLSFLRTKLGVPDNFKKIFSKIWGASGGWASGSCPHLVVYCLKFVLRGESPRDYTDLLRSLKHPPSVSISDIPHRLAIHTNNAVPGFFTPNDGRLFPATDINTQLAEEGKLQRRLLWLANNSLTCNTTPQEEGVHPTTGTRERYSLSDRFHERNSSNKADLLRRVTLVPELNGMVNTEAEEQMHRSINCSNYSLNNMNPVNHMFMMRLKIHLGNEERNISFREMLTNTFSAHAGSGINVTLNAKGRMHTIHSSQTVVDDDPSKEETELCHSGDLPTEGLSSQYVPSTEGSCTPTSQAQGVAEDEEELSKAEDDPSKDETVFPHSEDLPTEGLSSQYGPSTEGSCTPTSQAQGVAEDGEELRKAPTGLRNVYQTCWFGALLTCIANTALGDWLIEQGQNDKLSLLGQLSDLITRSRGREDKPSIDPAFALALFQSLDDSINIGNQQDVHEAFTLILHSINPKSSLNPSSASLSTSFVCEECSKASEQPETWAHFALSVDMTSDSLQDCITQTDTKSNPGRVFKECASCQKNTYHMKWINVIKEPEVLVLHLKRFDSSGSKVSKVLTINEILNIDALMSSGEQVHEYTLVSAVVHQGNTTQSGHYTSVVKRMNTWFNINDETVSPITEGEMQRICMKMAYLLFYRKRNGTISTKGMQSIQSSFSEKNILFGTAKKTTKKGSDEVSKKAADGLATSGDVSEKEKTSLLRIKQTQVEMTNEKAAANTQGRITGFDGTPIRNIEADDIRLLISPQGRLNAFVVNQYITLVVEALNRSQRVGNIGMLTSYQFSEWKAKFSQKKKSHDEDDPVSTDYVKAVTSEFYNKDIIIVPVHVKCRTGVDHWCLLVVDIEKKTLSYFDPLALDIGVKEAIDAIKQILSRAFDIASADLDSWTSNIVKDDPRFPVQTNSYDCGVFICLYALCIFLPRTIGFSQVEVPEIRNQMAFEILRKNLMDDVESQLGAFFQPFPRRPKRNIKRKYKSSEFDMSHRPQQRKKTVAKGAVKEVKEINTEKGNEEDEEVLDFKTKDFIKGTVPFLKSLLLLGDNEQVESERLRASKVLSRRHFKDTCEIEFWRLQSCFGTQTLMAFQVELLKHFFEETPESELSDTERLHGARGRRLVKFPNTHGFISSSDVICSIFLPELMIRYEMRMKTLSYEEVMTRVFKCNGHTIFWHAMKKEERDEKHKQKGGSRRKTRQPRRIRKINNK